MDTLDKILVEKGRQVHCVSPGESALSAARTMMDRHIGAVLVMEHGVVLGIVSERDLATRVLIPGRDPSVVTAGEIMTRDLVVATPSTAVREAMAVMTEKRCRHLPVMDESGLAGLISIGDLTRCVSRDQEFTIKHLKDYIQNKYPA